MSVERDENYVPRTRSDYGLPRECSATILDYRNIFEETPIYTLIRMVIMQLFGWHYYLLTNAMGSPMYPPGTNVGSVLNIVNRLLKNIDHAFTALPTFLSALQTP